MCGCWWRLRAGAASGADRARRRTRCRSMSLRRQPIDKLIGVLALRDLGCDLAQGYLLDRPARVEDLAAIIMRNFAKGLQRRPGREASPAAEVIKN